LFGGSGYVVEEKFLL
jgi:hypothetical protein